MKILKSLSKSYFTIIIVLILGTSSYAEDQEQTIDIWNLEKTKKKDNSTLQKIVITDEENSEESFQSDIYKMQTNNESNDIEFEEKLNSKNIKIVGLYDPEDYGLDINMWSNSDGNQIKNILLKLNKIDLSKDASEIMKISMLTNAYYPQKNISEAEFLKFKSDWLIKNSDLDLVEEYLVKNQIFNKHPELVRYLVDHYLSDSNLKKSCEIFSKNLSPVNDQYLSKFNIYCLIKSGKKDEAQIIFDLKKELGLKDKYFEKKINFLLGYETKNDETISEKSVLDFHLAHQTSSNFIFEPKETTKKIIWKYLASSNLLKSFDDIKVSEIDKISIIEKAVHNKDYPERDLLNLYKKFQFSINQLLNVKNSYKSLTNIEGRALIYQKILLESEMIEKLKLLQILKNSFKKDNIGNAFDVELKKFLEDIDPMDIPDNLTSFYYTNIEIASESIKKIKYNNDTLHQSKLISYFNGDYSDLKIQKEVNNFLRKIKKNKEYKLSKKDIIFLEALKSDGIKIEKKYDDLYEISASEIPSDIQVMVNNDEKGTALLRIVEVIGQDKLERIDEDTMYFIISTLNQLNINIIRNKILLKVLPLKV